MPIIIVESQYPVHKNQEVLAAWLSGPIVDCEGGAELVLRKSAA
jgi:hypothetical protein